MEARELEMLVLMEINKIDNINGLRFYTRKTREGKLQVYLNLIANTMVQIDSPDKIYDKLIELLHAVEDRATNLLDTAQNKLDMSV